MRNYFTPNDLIRFIYHEMTPAEEAQMRMQLAEDAKLAAELHRFTDVVTMLDETELQPSETSVNLILDYSREQVEEESHA
ncbi:MAG: hypothetical protein ACHQD9_04265 [Chitinophagales bacterium]